VDWVSLLSPLNTNDAWSLFKSIFQKVIDDNILDNIPTYKPRDKKNVLIKSEVFTLKKMKNKLWKKYRLANSLSK